MSRSYASMVPNGTSGDPAKHGRAPPDPLKQKRESMSFGSSKYQTGKAGFPQKPTVGVHHSKGIAPPKPRRNHKTRDVRIAGQTRQSEDPLSLTGAQ
jgi:hypothetical protein